MEAELVKEALESFDVIDEEKKGHITDKDHIYALFLSLGVTFDSEEEFSEALSIAINEEPVDEVNEEVKGEEEEVVEE